MAYFTSAFSSRLFAYPFDGGSNEKLIKSHSNFCDIVSGFRSPVEVLAFF